MPDKPQTTWTMLLSFLPDALFGTNWTLRRASRTHRAVNCNHRELHRLNHRLMMMICCLCCHPVSNFGEDYRICSYPRCPTDGVHYTSVCQLLSCYWNHRSQRCRFSCSRGHLVRGRGGPIRLVMIQLARDRSSTCISFCEFGSIR